MARGREPAGPADDGVRRVRLSAWAEEQGVSRITAYRMLRRGILPVPTERSPTGRWYVLVSTARARTERMAFYTRARQGPDQAHVLNGQIAALLEWAAFQRREVYIVVKEIGAPLTGRLPKLAGLLADPHISEIVVASRDVVGDVAFELLVAALAPQGRRITAVARGRRARPPAARETRTRQPAAPPPRPRGMRPRGRSQAPPGGRACRQSRRCRPRRRGVTRRAGRPRMRVRAEAAAVVGRARSRRRRHGRRKAGPARGRFAGTCSTDTSVGAPALSCMHDEALQVVDFDDALVRAGVRD